MWYLNRSDKLGAIANVCLTLVLVAIGNILIFKLDMGATDPAYLALPYSPPGWLVAVVWFCLYILWGLARWKVIQQGKIGLDAGWWILLLIVNGLLFPTRTNNFNIAGTLAESLFSLVLLLFVSWKVKQVSKPAFYLLLPSIGWTCFANLLSWVSFISGVGG